MNFSLSFIVGGFVINMADGGENTACLWKGGELDETFRYPPDPLGTSWGSYLVSLPTTARLAGRVFGREGEEKSNLNGEKDAAYPKRSQNIIHPAKTNSQEKAKPAPVKSSYQPRPSSLAFAKPLSAALQSAVEALVSCGIECTPLRHASDMVAKSQELVTTAREQGSDELLERGIEMTLEALVSQAEKIAEYATSLRRTGEMLAKNQRQFARDQQLIQQAIESAFSQIAEQQKLLEKKDHSQSNKSRSRVTKQKTFTEGLREGQHRLELQQTRKEHLRLEKILLQQQRDLRKLEQEYKITKSELAVEQYNTEQLTKKKSKIGLPTKPMHRGLGGIRGRLHKHNQRLEQLAQQMEDSKRELAKTGTRLRAGEREVHITGSSHPSILSPDPLPLKLPQISTEFRNYHNDPVTLGHQSSSNQDQDVLPELVLGHHDHGSTHTHGHFSRSELMQLATFTSPETAREVIHWLEQEGAISDK